MVVTDYFTRWVEAYALPNQKAETVARKLVQQFVCRFGTPMKLLSDQGTQFQGRLVTELCKLLGIEKIRTTAYHPQCDCMVERFNRTLAMMLTTAMEEAQDYDWETPIPQVCFAYNASVHETTGYAPFEMMFGRPPRLPVDAAFNKNMGKEMSTSRYVEELAAHLRNAFAAARKHSAEEQKRQRYYYNRKAGNMNYQTHEAVWLYCPVNKGKRNRKFATPWTGPFQIIEQFSGVNYRIRSIGSPRRTQLVHVNRLKRCKLTPAQLCSIRQKYNGNKEQDRRESQFNTKLRTYLVWAEEDHGHHGTSTEAMVAQRPQRNRDPPVRYNDYVFY
ncbi:Retrovirus-related Pol polyprotein from transposon [Trichinella nelsoni]|uniref:Retrovirus-related Pol polyprotein from transposon n=1 Tax=Trichinella nelsoni TaxID=6336 RepID=A0A0V0RJE1_9BILA|nr:Retrovirus-related Pol polyprotein from transposon [Trichinella nelsoni]